MQIIVFLCSNLGFYLSNLHKFIQVWLERIRDIKVEFSAKIVANCVWLCIYVLFVFR